MTQALESFRFHPTEVADLLKVLHSKYKNTAGTEIVVRYGTDPHSPQKSRVACEVFVWQDTDTVLYGGTLAQFFGPDAKD